MDRLQDQRFQINFPAREWKLQSVKSPRGEKTPFQINFPARGWKPRLCRDCQARGCFPNQLPRKGMETSHRLRLLSPNRRHFPNQFPRKGMETYVNSVACDPAGVSFQINFPARGWKPYIFLEEPQRYYLSKSTSSQGDGKKKSK